jgi:hypothetical protein
MVYNPQLQRWEGNEHALTKFENPSTSTLPLHPTYKDNHSHHHHTNSIPSTIALAPRDHNAGPRHGSPPRPALISQISTTRGVVVERGMVFDPQRMTWLKIDSRTLANDPMLQMAGLGPRSRLVLVAFVPPWAKKTRTGLLAKNSILAQLLCVGSAMRRQTGDEKLRSGWGMEIAWVIHGAGRFAELRSSTRF